ncbi:protein serine/threonine phosphatase 2C [Martensiomyces pterosporus]|nr:protein serine/threonine phosphatase 2C [Martensiomyces pterosporus]
MASRRTDGSSGSTRTRVPKSYTFSHAATGIPKHENRAAPIADPAEDELATSSGEDAFFHRSDALGIADGVGGWAGVKNADPSLFARRLMHHVHMEVQRYDDIDDEMFSHYYEAAPVDILRRAYEITVDEMDLLAMRGSSTACVVVLRGDELRVANLGDCGLTVVRQGDMVYRTEEQQHSFNFPYQLGTEEHSDRPSDSQVFRLKIQKGDIIIVGSDGVFDNLFDEDILEEARPKLSLPQFHVDPEAISLAIAKRAKLVSEDTRYAESPFQMRAIQEGLYYQGGKRDDITVVVAIVTDLEDTPDRR